MPLPDRPKSNLPEGVAEPRMTHRRPAALDASVLSLLRQCTKPVTAYGLAERSQASPVPLSPMQAYRVLDRLMEQGLVRRVELLSAYTLDGDMATGFMVCRHCDRCESFPVPRYAQIIERLQSASGFAVSRSVFEMSGTCQRCLDAKEGKKERTVRHPRRRMLSLIIGAGLITVEAPADAESSRRSAHAVCWSGEEARAAKLQDILSGIRRLECRHGRRYDCVTDFALAAGATP
jgi:Fur family transcriptional regulator, zinc uptake regulator